MGNAGHAGHASFPSSASAQLLSGGGECTSSALTEPGCLASSSRFCVARPHSLAFLPTVMQRGKGL